MPHPTPVQTVYGSVTVVSLTLLLLVFAPEDLGAASLLIAAGALAAGTAVALLVGSRRRAERPTPEPAPASAHPRPAPARATERARVRV